MAETDDPNVRKITWRDREWRVSEPSPEQIAVIYRMSRLRPAAETSMPRQLATLNRVPTLLEALIVDEADWDDIEDDLAAKRVTVGELIEPITEAIRVWAAPANRATKRAAAKKTTARAL
jgi:hypothetical protein